MLGQRLRLARKKAGFSMRELAERISPPITGQAISKYEAGRMMPSSAVLIGLGRTLDVSLDFLTGGAPSMLHLQPAARALVPAEHQVDLLPGREPRPRRPRRRQERTVSVLCGEPWAVRLERAPNDRVVGCWSCRVGTPSGSSGPSSRLRLP